MKSRKHSARRRVAAGLLRVSPLVLAIVAATTPLPGHAIEFRAGELSGSADFRVAYGAMWRTENRDKNIIGLSDGGKAYGGNADDGNLNYDTGLVSNMVEGNAELTVRWRNFGAFVSGRAFYDYENDENDREFLPLTSKSDDYATEDAELLEQYLSTRFMVGDTPFMFRLGEQVVSWGESRFITEGVNIINPLNGPLAVQPTSQLRNLRRPQGMLWGATGVTDTLAMEAYYQYDWEKTIPPAHRSYFGTADFGAPGSSIAMLGYGDWSSAGTNVSDHFGFEYTEPLGGLDEGYYGIPRIGDETPDEGGQYGLSAFMVLPFLNDATVALHYARYHSRLPLVATRTPSEEYYAGSDAAGVNAKAEELVEFRRAEHSACEAMGGTGCGTAPALPDSPGYEDAVAAEKGNATVILIEEFGRAINYWLEYPEDIDMFGLSFNTTTIQTGTAIHGEYSFHKDRPYLYDDAELLLATYTGFQSNPAFKNNQIGEFGPDEIFKGYTELDKSVAVLGITQLLGPQLGASMATVVLEAGMVHIHEFPSQSVIRMEAPATFTTGNPEQAVTGGTHPGKAAERPSDFADANSWGYRMLAQLRYTNVLGRFNLTPKIIWTHDVQGNTPSPDLTFIENRKSITAGLGTDFLNAFDANLQYTNYFGANRFNLINDRDNVQFTISYQF